MKQSKLSTGLTCKHEKINKVTRITVHPTCDAKPKRKLPYLSLTLTFIACFNIPMILEIYRRGDLSPFMSATPFYYTIMATSVALYLCLLTFKLLNYAQE